MKKTIGEKVLFCLCVLILFNVDTAFGTNRGVEIDWNGLSAPAKNAIQNMNRARKDVKNSIKDPWGRIKKLKQTYRDTCGSGQTADSGCYIIFNQMIDAYTEVANIMGKFLEESSEHMGKVVNELEPQIRKAAYTSSPSDMVEDITQKYTGYKKKYRDPLLESITNSLGFKTGKTPFEMASSYYTEYKYKLAEYKDASQQLRAKIFEAEQRKSLAPLINKTFETELREITSWIFGNTFQNENIDFEDEEEMIPTVLK